MEILNVADHASGYVVPGEMEGTAFALGDRNEDNSLLHTLEIKPKFSCRRVTFYHARAKGSSKVKLFAMSGEVIWEGFLDISHINTRVFDKRSEQVISKIHIINQFG